MATKTLRDHGRGEGCGISRRTRSTSHTISHSLRGSTRGTTAAGVYFDDPDGHRLEIITRPYGSGGTEAQNVHPLVAPTIEPANGPAYPQNIH